MLDFTFLNHTKNTQFERDFFYNILDRAANLTGLGKQTVGLSLSLVEELKIKSLNRDFRCKDLPTDVLSFSVGANIPKNDILELGDIFICPDVAQKNIESEKVSLENQLEILTIHGFLHLLGYDHQTRQEEKKMFATQNKILKKNKKWPEEI
jgi:probable rRNA maturation factor